LTKGDLCAVVMQLVKDYLGNRKTSTDQPLKVTAVLFYFWYLTAMLFQVPIRQEGHMDQTNHL
jgi:hypothetical protein